jgi:hypothetical protein
MGTIVKTHSLEGKKKLLWAQAQNGDKVYVAGNIERGEPTVCYGPHIIKDAKHRVLCNGAGRCFYEQFPYVYKTEGDNNDD